LAENRLYRHTEVPYPKLYRMLGAINLLGT
jgi:hypothetical protein